MHQTPSVYLSAVTPVSVLPKSLIDQLDKICPVAFRNARTGSHGEQAVAEDIKAHGAQLGGRQLTRELSEPGHVLSGKFGQIFPLQLYSKRLRQLSHVCSHGPNGVVANF